MTDHCGRDYKYRGEAAEIADGLVEAADPKRRTPQAVRYLRCVLSLPPRRDTLLQAAVITSLRDDVAAAHLSAGGPLRAGAAAAGLCHSPACVAAMPATTMHGHAPTWIEFMGCCIDAGTIVTILAMHVDERSPR